MKELLEQPVHGIITERHELEPGESAIIHVFSLRESRGQQCSETDVAAPPQRASTLGVTDRKSWPCSQ